MSVGGDDPDHLAECAETLLSIYLPIYLYIKIYITYKIWEWLAVALTYLPTPRVIYLAIHISTIYLPIYLSTIYLLNRALVAVALTTLPNASTPSYPYIYLSTYVTIYNYLRKTSSR